MSSLDTTLTGTRPSSLAPAGVVAQDRVSQWLGPVAAGVLTLIIFYLSLIATSVPVSVTQRSQIDRAIALVEAKGFTREAFMLKHMVSFRGSGNWLNSVTSKENAFAATNFPFCIVTVYPDFFERAKDDTERAMILLHEAQHLRGASEHRAYAYVWQNRQQLGWTSISHGTTETFVTVEEQTRENAPELFTCPQRAWSDCTETLASVR